LGLNLLTQERLYDILIIEGEIIMIKRDDIQKETERLDKLAKEKNINQDTIEGLILKGLSVLIKIVANIRSNQTAIMKKIGISLREKKESSDAKNLNKVSYTSDSN